MTHRNDILTQLGFAIASESDELTLYLLEFASDGLKRAIRDFNRAPNGNQLTILNGAWANAKRTLEMTRPHSQSAAQPQVIA